MPGSEQLAALDGIKEEVMTLRRDIVLIKNFARGAELLLDHIRQTLLRRAERRVEDIEADVEAAVNTLGGADPKPLIRRIESALKLLDQIKAEIEELFDSLERAEGKRADVSRRLRILAIEKEKAAEELEKAARSDDFAEFDRLAAAVRALANAARRLLEELLNDLNSYYERARALATCAEELASVASENR